MLSQRTNRTTWTGSRLSLGSLGCRQVSQWFMYEVKAPRSFWIFVTRCWPVQVSGPLVGGGCSDKSPQVTWPPPQLWIPDFQTCPLPIFYRWEV